MKRKVNIQWRRESEVTTRELGIRTRYAKEWKWQPGQNGKVTTRKLTPGELRALGL